MKNPQSIKINGTLCWIVTCLAFAFSAVAVRGESCPVRWVYVAKNLADSKNAAEAAQLIARAARAGFNGVVLADNKFMTLEKYGYSRPGHPYNRNVVHIRHVAAQHHIEIVPYVPMISGAHGMFAYDPNLAEGFEVRDAIFEVRMGVAELFSEGAPVLEDGEFEEAESGRFVRWAYQDDPGAAVSPDRTVVKSGNQSLRLEPSRASRFGLCRIYQKIKVQPRRCYRVSVWLRTEELEPAGSFKVSVTGLSAQGDRSLSSQRLEVDPTASWKQVHVIFNSLGFQEIGVHLGLWGGRRGRAWLDKCEVAEVGLVNVLRRPGCPLTVRSEDGTKTYIEGRDFFPVSDPLLGRPRDWPGMYSRYHKAPAIRMRNELPDGTRLKVGFYHPLQDKFSKVDACMSEPTADELFERQITHLNHLFDSPQRYLLGYNEIRAAGSCAACKATGKTPGQILADHVRRTAAIMNRIRPGVELATWHDMFDPSANAVDAYGLVEGTLQDSWLGLPKDMLIVNWTVRDADLDKSLRFFSNRGHLQVRSIDFDKVADTEASTRDALSALADVDGTEGVMYTTWKDDYRYLEEAGGVLSSPETQSGLERDGQAVSSEGDESQHEVTPE